MIMFYFQLLLFFAYTYSTSTSPGVNVKISSSLSKVVESLQGTWKSELSPCSSLLVVSVPDENSTLRLTALGNLSHTLIIRSPDPNLVLNRGKKFNQQLILLEYSEVFASNDNILHSELGFLEFETDGSNKVFKFTVDDHGLDILSNGILRSQLSKPNILATPTVPKNFVSSEWSHNFLECPSVPISDPSLALIQSNDESGKSFVDVHEIQFDNFRSPSGPLSSTNISFSNYLSTYWISKYTQDNLTIFQLQTTQNINLVFSGANQESISCPHVTASTLKKIDSSCFFPNLPSHTNNSCNTFEVLSVGSRKYFVSNNPLSFGNAHSMCRQCFRTGLADLDRGIVFLGSPNQSQFWVGGFQGQINCNTVFWARSVFISLDSSPKRFICNDNAVSLPCDTQSVPSPVGPSAPSNPIPTRAPTQAQTPTRAPTAPTRVPTQTPAPTAPARVPTQTPTRVPTLLPTRSPTPIISPPCSFINRDYGFVSNFNATYLDAERFCALCLNRRLMNLAFPVLIFNRSPNQQATWIGSYNNGNLVCGLGNSEHGLDIRRLWAEFINHLVWVRDQVVVQSDINSKKQFVCDLAFSPASCSTSVFPRG